MRVYPEESTYKITWIIHLMKIQIGTRFYLLFMIYSNYLRFPVHFLPASKSHLLSHKAGVDNESKVLARVCWESGRSVQFSVFCSLPSRKQSEMHACYLRSIIDSKRNKNVEKKLSHKNCEIWRHLNIFQKSEWVSEVVMQSSFQNEKTSWNARDLVWYFV